MKGVNPAWSNLPRRKCDDCGKSYKPKQPLRKDTRGFCSDNCRKSYHKHGGAYRKLKAEMVKLVAKHMAAINEANQTELRILVENGLRSMRASIAIGNAANADPQTLAELSGLNQRIADLEAHVGLRPGQLLKDSLPPIVPAKSNPVPRANRLPRA